MAGIGDYLAKFTADLSGFLKPMEAGEKAVGSLKKSVMSLDEAMGFANPQKEAQKNIDNMKKSMSEYGATATKVGGALFAASSAITGAVLGMAKMTAVWGDSLREAAIRTGLTVEELSRLKFAAEQSGAELSDLEAGLRFLSKNAVAAAEGTKQQSEAFKNLGVSVVDASGKMRPTNDILLDMADRFAKMPAGAQKSAAAIEIFGKGGAALIPVLNEGRAGIQAMGDELEALGGVMSTEAAEAADEFQDSWHRGEKAITGLITAIGGAFIPTLTKLMDTITPLIAEFGQFINAHPKLIELVGALAVTLGGAGGLLLALGGVMTVLPLISTALAALGVAGGPVFLVIGAIAALVAVIFTFRKEIAAFVTHELSTFVDGLSTMIGFAATVAEKLGMRGISGGLRSAADSTANFSTKLAQMSKGFKEGTKVVDDNKKAVKDLGEGQEALALNLNKAKEAQDKWNKEVKTARDSILGVKEPTAAWMTALKDLDAKGQLSARAILGLKNEIMGLTNSKDPLIQKYRALIPLLETATSRYEAQKQVTAGLASATRDLTTIKLPGWMTSPDPIISAPLVPEKFQEDLEKDMNQAFDSMHATQDSIRADQKATADAAAANMKAAVEDVKRSAGEIFDAMFLKGENVFTSLGNLLKGGALSLGRSIFEDITGALLGPVKKAFDDFFGGIMKDISDRLGGVMSDMVPGVGGAVPDAPGVPGIPGGAPGAGGAVGSAGGMGSAIVGGLVGGIVSGLGSFFSSMRLEGTMNAVEKNTRYTEIQLRDTMEQILWPMHGMLERSSEYIQLLGIHLIPAIEYATYQIRTAIFEMVAAVSNFGSSLQSIANSISGLGSSLSSLEQRITTPPPIVSNTSAPYVGSFHEGTNYVPNTGWAMVERGEKITPAAENIWSQPTTLILQIDGRDFARVVIPLVNDQVKFGGMQLVASEVR